MGALFLFRRSQFSFLFFFRFLLLEGRGFFSHSFFFTMNYLQDNKLSMYLAVQKNCQANAPHWSTNPIAAQTFADLEQCIAGIQQGLRQQARSTTGVSLDKAGTRQTMTRKAYAIAQALVTYGHLVNNQELVHLVEHKPSVWDRYPANLAKEKVEQVLQAARLHSAELTNYGIQADHLTELESLLQAYSEKVGAPRRMINERRDATLTLGACFKKADFLLQQLDNLLLLHQDKPFYSTYKIARQVVRRRPRGEKAVLVATQN